MRKDKKTTTNLRESETVDLKLDYKESIRKNIIVFTNTSRNTIYIGIADEDTVVGNSSADQTIQRVANMVKDTAIFFRGPGKGQRDQLVGTRPEKT